MLRCNEFTKVVTDYLEGCLPLSERVDIFLHLRSCPACRGYLGQMNATRAHLRELAAPSPPRAVRDALRAYFRRGRCARGEIGPAASAAGGCRLDVNR